MASTKRTSSRVVRKRTAKKHAARKRATKKRSAKKSPTRSAVDRLREICLALPSTSEVEAWGEPTFRVNGKIFAMHASASTHHGFGRPAVWILSVNIEQDLVIRARPDRYFKPPYVGPSGWIGAWLDKNPPWAEIEELLRDGWRRRAPKRVAALLD
ncbi:MAG TPA: MmcQ/YjbR family DNA-binding protein [Gemmatimonadaceae bacterium]|nr:MmcQ/YjbR family DNA-binding protein [Gemmatimonadaceae bacterium]